MANTKIPVELSSTPGIVDNSNATAITIDSSENVGIGTASPTGKLGIYGGGISDIPLVITHAWGSSSTALISASNSSSEVFKVERSGNVTLKGNDLNLNNGSVEHRFTNDNTNLLIRADYGNSAASSTIQFSVDGTERMRIDSSGNVGIGVSSLFSPGGSRKLLQISNSTSGAIIAMNNNTDESLNPRIFSDANNLGFATPNTGSGVFQFYTAGSERMRIDSSGNLLVGTTSSFGVANNGLVVAGSSMVNSNVGILHIRSLDSGETADECIASFVSYRNDSTTSNVFIKFAIDQYNTGCGQINANGANQAAFGSFSDSRLKENIVDLPNQLNNIKSLRPVEFDFIKSEGGGHQIGFVAQEVEEIYPDLVGEREDGMKTLTGIGKMEARLIKAIQEQQTQIEALQSEINELKNS